MATYRNLFYNSLNRDSKEFIKTTVKPIEYKGYLIYQIIKDEHYDVVLNGVCISQRAGLNGAKRFIDGV
ncbi:hypothetical protein [Paenimyroides ceti]